jgi:hypothetical protein
MNEILSFLPTHIQSLPAVQALIKVVETQAKQLQRQTEQLRIQAEQLQGQAEQIVAMQVWEHEECRRTKIPLYLRLFQEMHTTSILFCLINN